MPLIQDPDLLNQGTEVIIDPNHFTIQLVKAGNLTDDGVTLQCLYSFLKEEWKNDATLIKLPFPMEPITSKQFELIAGWRFRDYQTIKLLRSGGFAIKDDTGNSLQEYIGFISLGSLDTTDQIYIQQKQNGLPKDIFYPGPANEPILVYSNATVTGEYLGTGDGSRTTFHVTMPPIDPGSLTVYLNGMATTDYTVDNDTGEIVFNTAPSSGVEVTADYTSTFSGDIDYRSYFKCFCREQGKTYAQADISDAGVTEFTYETYPFALSVAIDTKITHDDAYISSNAPYTGMSITYLRGHGFTTWDSATTYDVDYVVQASNGRWYRSVQSGNVGHDPTTDDGTWWESYLGERQIGSGWYAFNRIIEGNGARLEEIYEFVQYMLRQETDIDSGPDFNVIGKTADLMLHFLGDTLVTYPGVYVDNFNAQDTNRIEFYDVLNIKRTFPYVAAGVIEFNQNLQDDPDAIYVMYFKDPDGTDGSGDEFGTVGAIIVQDNDGNPIQGTVSGQASISFSFDYDGNTQGGRTPGTDAEVVVVAMGLSKAQHVIAQGVITRSTQNKFTLVAPLERNYVNP